MRRGSRGCRRCCAQSASGKDLEGDERAHGGRRVAAAEAHLGARALGCDEPRVVGARGEHAPHLPRDRLPRTAACPAGMSGRDASRPGQGLFHTRLGG